MGLVPLDSHETHHICWGVVLQDWSMENVTRWCLLSKAYDFWCDCGEAGKV